MRGYETEFSWRIHADPKVCVVITHHNYSHFVEGAIDSVLAQTFQNLTCIVVDDASDLPHLTRLQKIISQKNGNVILVQCSENLGQIHAFYRGIEDVNADFYCILDPDDRYTETFVEEMVCAHLNPYAYMPLVCCDQMCFSDTGQVTGVYSRNRVSEIYKGIIPKEHKEKLTLFSAYARNWTWTSTSAMMFRKHAIDLLKPNRKLPFARAADTYLATGCRYLGGTIFYTKRLVLRNTHCDNSFLDQRLISINQNKKRPSFGDVNALNDTIRGCVMENLLQNSALEIFSKKHFRRILYAEFKYHQVRQVIKNASKASKILSPFDVLKMYFGLKF